MTGRGDVVQEEVVDCIVGQGLRHLPIHGGIGAFVDIEIRFPRIHTDDAPVGLMMTGQRVRPGNGRSPARDPTSRISNGAVPRRLVSSRTNSCITTWRSGSPVEAHITRPKYGRICSRRN